MLRRREFLGAGAALLLPKLAMPASGAGRNCILLNLTGGPSQLDTWDMKPDAPSNIRGPFRPVRTNVPGIEIAEIFPRMARHADKFALIRSCHYEGAALHDAGHYCMQTGYAYDPDVQRSHLSGGQRHIVLPFHIAGSGGNIPNAAAEASLLRLHEFDTQSEPEAVRRRYGLNTFGQSCLMARRLIETGAPFVTVNMSESVFGEKTWDSHGSKPFSTIADYRDHVAPVFDRAYSALLEDLSSRGLLSGTLVAGIGEFGRSPRINPSGGRDHWPQCFTVLLAGAGIVGGQVYGSSDATAAEPRDNPVNPAVLAATMRRALKMPLEDPAASPIEALFV